MSHRVDKKPSESHIEIPTFEVAAYDKPMKYLKELLEYFKASNITQKMFEHVVSQSLRGPGGDSWELIQDHVQTIAEFKNRFMERYRCRQTRANIRNQLELGFNQAQGNLSRSEYVIRLYNQVRMLSDAPREADTVD